MQNNNMDQKQSSVHTEEKTISPVVKRPVKINVIIAAVIVLSIVTGIWFIMFSKKSLQSTSIVPTPTTVPLETKYTNPFDEKSSYENPFSSSDEYQNPFDF